MMAGPVQKVDVTLLANSAAQALGYRGDQEKVGSHVFWSSIGCCMEGCVCSALGLHQSILDYLLDLHVDDHSIVVALTTLPAII